MAILRRDITEACLIKDVQNKIHDSVYTKQVRLFGLLIFEHKYKFDNTVNSDGYSPNRSGLGFGQNKQ